MKFKGLKTRRLEWSFICNLLLQVLMSRGGVGKGPLKDAFIMSSLPPEDDPLFAGLQGVDSVIEHFIKNAQGESRSHFLHLLKKKKKNME